MPYSYGMQNSPAVGNGLGGLPRRNALTVPTVYNQDLYSRKKVRLVKVGALTSVPSTTTLLSDCGAPIPMGFGRFAISKSSTTIAVVDYDASGILQIRSNATIAGRSLSGSFLRGSGGNGYWYNAGAQNLYRINASGASASSATLLATISTAAASGTITNGGASYSSLSLPTSNRIVAKYGDNLVVVGTATVSVTTKMVAVLFSLTSATVTAVFDLGAANTADTVLQAVAVYKDILTVFWLNQNTSTNTVTITPIQFNLQTQQLTNLTVASNMNINQANGATVDPVCYACDGAVWVDMTTSSATRINYNYGFATNSSGVAVNHVATVNQNGVTLSATFNTSFLENRTGNGRVKDFDFNLVYGYSASSAFENSSDIKNAETVLLENDFRFQAMARARAPIAFLESSKRLPVSLSLVCAGTGDQSAGVASTSGYDALLVYLDDGYWVLMATDGDSAVPSYNGYLQLYREA